MILSLLCQHVSQSYCSFYQTGRLWLCGVFMTWLLWQIAPTWHWKIQTQRSSWEHTLSASCFDGLETLPEPIVGRGYNAAFQTHSLASHLYWEALQVIAILISKIIRKNINPRFLSVSMSHTAHIGSFVISTPTVHYLAFW